MMNIEETKELIKTLHGKQLDWIGEPYYLHPIAVMNRLPATVSDECRIIALLHDTVEDNTITLMDLFKKGYSNHVLDGVNLLTRHPSKKMTYLEGIKNIVSSGNIDAMLVKLADNVENTDDKRNLKLTDEQFQLAIDMRPRYEKSKKILRDGLIALGVDVSWSK